MTQQTSKRRACGLLAGARPLHLALAGLLAGGALSACGTSQPSIPPDVGATAVAATSAAASQAGPTSAADVEVAVPTPEVGLNVTATVASTSAGPAVVNLSQLNSNPSQYIGQQVVVTGDVSEMFGPRSFSLNEPNQTGLDHTLVVAESDGVIPSDLSADAAVNNQVEVTGTVRAFDQAALEQDLGYQFEGNWTEGLNGVPTIIASDITLLNPSAGQAAQPTSGADQAAPTGLPTVSSAPGDQPTVGPVATEGAGAAIPEAAQGNFPYVSVGQIDVSPDAYMGQRVTAYGQVDAQLGPNTFRVDEGNFLDIAGQILLVIPEGAPRPDNLQNETNIVITGMVQPYVAGDFQRDYGVQFDDPSIEDQLDGQPALIADIVYTQATVSDLDDDTEAYVGDRVSVVGDVTSMVDANTFRLSDPSTVGGDDILVFMRDAANSSLVTGGGESVLVTGEVRAYDLATLQTDLGYTWNSADLNGFSGSAVLVAEQIQAADTTTQP